MADLVNKPQAPQQSTRHQRTISSKVWQAKTTADHRGRIQRERERIALETVGHSDGDNTESREEEGTNLSTDILRDTVGKKLPRSYRSTEQDMNPLALKKTVSVDKGQEGGAV